MIEEESCKVCHYNFLLFEHYVMTKGGNALCENCFFEIALKELESTSHQFGIDEEPWEEN